MEVSRTSLDERKTLGGGIIQENRKVVFKELRKNPEFNCK